VRIAILAPFSAFDDSYSLAHAVAQQVRALEMVGHDVELWTLANLNPDSEPMLAGMRQTVKPCIPVTIWQPDVTTPHKAEAIRKALAERIQVFRPGAIITHDALFQAWYIDTARAIHELTHAECNGESWDIRWFHIAHSVVDPAAPPPHEDQKYRRTLPEGHELIALSHTHADDLAKYYSTTRDRVHVIPNCHDPRHIWKMHPAAEAMLKRADLLNRDIVQVYPFCATRAGSKGIPQLLRIFEAMQKHADAALVLCDANAQTDGAKLAWSLAAELAPNVEVFRMSSIEGCAKGTPHRAVMDLMRLSNLFIFPTQGEACPLILAEAMQAGCVVAINSLVGPLVEYAPHNALRFSLPAIGHRVRHHATVTTTNGDGTQTQTTYEDGDAETLVLEQIAERCIEAVRLCPAAQAKVAAFRTFSLESHGRRWEEVLRT